MEDGETLDYQRALKQLVKMNFAIEQGDFNPADWTLKGFKEHKFEAQADRWLRAVKDGGSAPETGRTYKSYVHNHFIKFPGFADRQVRAISYANVEDFKAWLGDRVAVNTRKRIMGALHAFFAWMYRRGSIRQMPPWPIVEGEEIVKRATDFEGQGKLLQAVSEVHREIFEFGMETGLRPNELCALQVGDLDMINRMALIQRGYSGPVLHERTKGKTKRWIPLSARAYEIAMKHSRGKLPSTFLFTNPNTGRGYTLSGLDNIWARSTGRRLSKNEAMRHSFITQLFEAGASIPQVQALSRHKDKRSLDAYTHLSPERLRDLVDGRGKSARNPQGVKDGKSND
ncbi:MAG: site-specific tyrosine recombinase XerD [Thermodesulfovibrionales bacterium]